MTPMFSALGVRNYRLYFGGQVLSNTGAWMQRLAQDWLVLDLSGSSSMALGITVGLQFLPYLLFSLWGGTIADRIPRRRLLTITQTVMALISLVVGVLALRGDATVALVYVAAFSVGVASAFDNPGRQAFVNELVGGAGVGNAIALNSASFNLARLVGPAIAGLLIAAIGTGWVFVLTASTFAVGILTLRLVRPGDLHPVARQQGQVRLKDGLTYTWRHRNLVLAVLLALLVGALGLNYQQLMAMMARNEFGLGAEAFGLMSTALAFGALLGSLTAARRRRVSLTLVGTAALVFGTIELINGLAPTYVWMLVILPFAGFGAMTFITAVQTYLQSNAEDWVRGRVMGIFTLVFYGANVFSAPAIGWVGETWGARWAMIACAVTTLLTSSLAIAWYAWRGRRRGATARERAAAEVVAGA